MDNEYKRLNPRCKTAMYIGYAIALAILVLLYVGVRFLVAKENDSYLEDMDLAFLIILMICLAYCIAAPQVFYRRYKYILTSDKVDVLRGVIIVRHTVVPIERIHQVDVVRGPINNMLGLADVIVTTAGGVAKIEFLDTPEADRIAEELNRIVTEILKDRN